MAAAIVISERSTAANTTAASVAAAPAAIASATALGLTDNCTGRSRPIAIPAPAPTPPVPFTVLATNTQLTSSPGTIPSTAATRL